MMDFTNANICTGEEQRKETVKEVLDNMGEILTEIEREVTMIAEAVYRGSKSAAKETTANEPCATPPMIVIMRKQRDFAEDLLKEIVEIREMLW